MSTSTTTQETSLDVEENLDDEKHNTAPIELLSEFLSSLMLRDYETALVHCKTILHYEPDNQTVVDFYPLIQQRLNEAEEDSSIDDQEMESFASDDDSWASSLSTSSDEYSTASNSLWTTGTEGSDKDETTVEVINAHDDDDDDDEDDDDDCTEEALDEVLNQGSGTM